MDEEVATEGTTTVFFLLLLLNDDDDVEELAVLAIEEVDGVRLISVNKSFRPLRKYSWRNLQYLAVCFSSLWSMRNVLENFTLRKP